MIGRKKTDRRVPLLSSHHLPAILPGWEDHAHSCFSDGKASPRRMAEGALKRGLSRLIFTEHTEPWLTPGGNWFAEYQDEIDRLRHSSLGEQIELVIGLEVPVIDRDGRLLLTEEMMERVDFVLGAVHGCPDAQLEGEPLLPETAIEWEFTGLMHLASDPRIDAIAHPGGYCQSTVTPFPMALFAEVVAQATRNGIGIELNPAYQIPIAPYAEICRQTNALITLGSNAHRPEHLGQARSTVQAWLDANPSNPSGW